ncbi:MAG TPA: bifunctional nuclease family protein [Acidimicrobiales bacterium]|nr:bifunctional nuclease family protein [Acidimicrobiales bacterium]
MTLASIRVSMPDNVPVVMLKEATGDPAGGRTLPILIGPEEATAIARAIQGIEPPRPLTHDLLRDLLHGLEVDVEAIVITELVDKIFYAEIRMIRDGRRYVVSSRPSDAIALAVRLGTPIHAEEALLDAEAYVIQEDEEPEEEQEEVIEQFQRFIEDIRPEDFAS